MCRAPMRLDRRHLLAIALGTALVPAGFGSAGADTPTARAEAVVDDLAGRVWALYQSGDLAPHARLDRLAELLRSKTDVALLSRLVLGQNWQRLTEDQQTRYQQLFGQVVIGNLARRLDQYANGTTGPLAEHFRITGSQDAGRSDVLVRSKVTPPTGDPVRVDWRLRERDGGPVIIDLVIEGVSLLVSQRAEFAAVIERSDMEGLLAELQARATSES
jgi:phospholipid transport system substrate-binding protein